MMVSTRHDADTGASYTVSLDIDTGAFSAGARAAGRNAVGMSWEPGEITRDGAVAWAEGILAETEAER
jgi:hypothetical protein